ncbi:hypothetical protein GSI_06799 [Ganoderma sinense ZZ0214-1]|uniref:Uncharacterized protein n=1 Tax=Ganoderma sinense ZZ0214-1 TaxID=1077348 RepID=A0A2G8SE96_9APHY|nr:hypothetical protein GSI_06799 [Ganoderma sinense ZZ0214-1]
MPPSDSSSTNDLSGSGLDSDSSLSRNSCIEEAQIPTDPDALSRADLTKALRAVQLENGKLRAQIKKVEEKNAVLKAALKREGKTEAQAQKAAAQRLPKGVDEHQVSMYGKKFAAMYKPWIEPHEHCRHRATDLDPFDPARFKDPEVQRTAVAAELQRVVFQDHHELLRKHLGFQTVLTKGMGATRSTSASTKVAKKAAQIFSLPPRYWENKCDRSQVPELIRLFTVSLAGFPPVLYTDFKPKPKNFLISIPLTMIGRSILFGGGSLDVKPSRTAKMNTALWDIYEVTEGFIAFIAILAIWAVSGDPHFVPTGEKTKFNYQDMHTKIKGFLIQTSNSDMTKKIMAYHQHWIFSSVSSGTHAQSASAASNATPAADSQVDPVDSLIAKVNSSFVFSDSEDEATTPSHAVPPGREDDGAEDRADQGIIAQSSLSTTRSASTRASPDARPETDPSSSSAAARKSKDLEKPPSARPARAKTTTTPAPAPVQVQDDMAAPEHEEEEPQPRRSRNATNKRKNLKNKT